MESRLHAGLWLGRSFEPPVIFALPISTAPLS
jgi:hypothetical protein